MVHNDYILHGELVHVSKIFVAHSSRDSRAGYPHQADSGEDLREGGNIGMERRIT